MKKRKNPGRPNRSDRAESGARQIILVGNEWDGLEVVEISTIEEPREKKQEHADTRQFGTMLIVLLAVLAGYAMGVDDLEIVRGVGSKITDAVLVVAIALTGSRLLRK